ncbi:MAG: family 20 glycosylhydrolase [Firmicutes bacterium]|nr:family 20 glycosylhydrolase [Candidatus Colimorpha enterica]
MSPAPAEVDAFCSLIDNVLAPDGVNTILLIVRYNYEYTSHPEVRGDQPLSLSDVKKIVGTCRRNGIELIPKMNLLGHQGIQDHASTPDGLARSHPEFLEIPLGGKQNVHFVLCPSHPDLFPFLMDLADELTDAFEAKTLHIGCDEVFSMGICDRCRGKDNGELFAGWVNRIAAHLKSRGITTMMWGDRMLDAASAGYGTWEASAINTASSLGKVDKDIIICDWHYENCPDYPSVKALTDAGYKLCLCTFSSPENAERFFDCARKQDKGNVLGTFHTTWMPITELLDRLKNNPRITEDGKDEIDWTGRVIRCYCRYYRGDDYLKLPKPTTPKNL